MVMFHSYVKLPEGNVCRNPHLVEIPIHLSIPTAAGRGSGSRKGMVRWLRLVGDPQSRSDPRVEKTHVGCGVVMDYMDGTLHQLIGKWDNHRKTVGKAWEHGGLHVYIF